MKQNLLDQFFYFPGHIRYMTIVIIAEERNYCPALVAFGAGQLILFAYVTNKYRLWWFYLLRVCSELSRSKTLKISIF